MLDNFTEDIQNQILSDQAIKKELRVQAFEKFVDGIESGKTAEELVKESLNI